MISLVIVNYRSSALTVEAIRSARDTTAANLEVLVVDNSEDDGEASRVRPHADVLLQSQSNIGYGAGINSAIDHCSGSTIIASNPDVVYHGGALDRLHAALQGGAAVAGPSLFWDAALRWRMPPADTHTFGEKLDAVLGTRSAAWRRWSDRRSIERRVDFWRRSVISTAAALSGAVLAFDAATLARHRFDEQFFLYFEETDLLRRIRRGGGSVLYVPDARCRHLFNQSAGASDRAPAEFIRSEWLYHTKWHGRLAAKTLLSLAATVESSPLRDAAEIHVPSDGLLVEASPLRGFETAAGTFADAGSVRPPADVVRSLGATPLFLRVLDPVTACVIDEVRWRGSHKMEK